MHDVGSIATIDSWGIDAIDAIITPGQLKELAYAGVAGGAGVLVTNLVLDNVPLDMVKVGYGRIAAKTVVGIAGAMALKHFMPSEPAASHGLAGAVIGDALLSLKAMLQAPAPVSGLGRFRDVQVLGPAGFQGVGVQEQTPAGYEETLSSWMY